MINIKISVKPHKDYRQEQLVKQAKTILIEPKPTVMSSTPIPQTNFHPSRNFEQDYSFSPPSRKSGISNKSRAHSKHHKQQRIKPKKPVPNQRTRTFEEQPPRPPPARAARPTFLLSDMILTPDFDSDGERHTSPPHPSLQPANSLGNMVAPSLPRLRSAQPRSRSLAVNPLIAKL